MVATTTRDRPTLRTRRRLIVGLARAATLAIVSLAAFVAWRWESGNLGAVEPNRVFRSAQLGPKEMTRVIRRHGIKTVVNLRGRNPQSAWYRLERDATLAAGAAHVDFSMASDMWLSRPQIHALLKIIKECEYPILIHCEWGSDAPAWFRRSSRLRARAGRSSRRASNSRRIIFSCPTPTAARCAHIDAYQSWLSSKHLSHSPESFVRWVEKEYRPLGPSREDWPYNPYPLIEIERPGVSKRINHS